MIFPWLCDFALDQLIVAKHRRELLSQAGGKLTAYPLKLCEVSALLNCGGFDKAFSSTDLSEYGLLTDHAKALNVQQLLRSEYPDERHAECDVWAIWQKIV